MNHFQGCKTIEEAILLKRELLLDYHPDRMNVITQQIMAEWDELLASVSSDGSLPEKYHAKGDPKVIFRNFYLDRVVERRVEVQVYLQRERIVYRAEPCQDFEAKRNEMPDRYFVENGVEFSPSLNQREADNWQGM